MVHGNFAQTIVGDSSHQRHWVGVFLKKIFGKTVDTGLKHGTVTIIKHGKGYEVTTYRIDGEYLDGRHPETVEFTPDLREDLKRRDFTINAMANAG